MHFGLKKLFRLSEITVWVEKRLFRLSEITVWAEKAVSLKQLLQKKSEFWKNICPWQYSCPGQVARSRRKRPTAAAKGAERLLGGPGGGAPQGSGWRSPPASRHPNLTKTPDQPPWLPLVVVVVVGDGS